MNKLVWLCFLACFMTTAALAASRDRLFDAHWRFLRADTPSAQQPEFDDSKWRRLDVPHDWSIEDVPSGNSESISIPMAKILMLLSTFFSRTVCMIFSGFVMPAVGSPSVTRTIILGFLSSAFSKTARRLVFVFSLMF